MPRSRSIVRSIAVVGCGHWGPNHIRAFKTVPGVAVTWLVDANVERLRQMSAQFHDVRVTTRLEDPLADPTVDAVVVATPAAAHTAITLAALGAGKHVLCEKPLTTSSTESRELVHLAASRGLVLMVGHVFLFNPGIREIKRLLNAGDLGRLRYASAERANSGPIRQDVNVAWDLASHEIAIFDFLFDASPVAVSASGLAIAERGREDLAFITLTYPNHVMARITASWLHPRKVRVISVVGDAQMATFDDLAAQPVTIYRPGSHGRAEPYIDSYGEFCRLGAASQTSQPDLGAVEPLKEQARHFIRALDTGDAGVASGVHGWAVVRTLEAVSESMRRNGEPVEIHGRLPSTSAA